MVLWPEAFTAKRQANGYRLKSILKSVARAREQGWYGVNCHQRSGGLRPCEALVRVAGMDLTRLLPAVFLTLKS